MKFTYITTCKGRLHHIRQTLPAALAAGNAEFIVVDYGCPDGTGAWVREHHPAVTVVTVADDPGFNLARARNFGAAAARTPWLGFFDADVLLGPGFFARVEAGVAAGHYYVPDSGDPNTWGSCLVERDAFNAAGGYDEAIDNWGGEDNDLYAALAMHGIRRGHYPGHLLVPVRHSDAERTRYQRITNLDRAVRVSDVYRTIKFDLMRLSARALTLEERRQLRAQALRMVEEAAGDGGGASKPLQLVLPERAVKTRPKRAEAEGPALRSILVYTLARYGQEHETPPEAERGGDEDRVPGEP